MATLLRDGSIVIAEELILAEDFLGVASSKQIATSHGPPSSWPAPPKFSGREPSQTGKIAETVNISAFQP